jgi:hypothetical protein
MNDIQVDRYDRRLRRLLDIRGGVVCPTLGPELIPVVDVEPGRPPENEYTRGESLFVQNAYVAALAANYSAVQLRNPSADRLIVIERILASADCWMTMLAANIGNIATTPQARDWRYIATAYPAGVLYAGQTLNAAASGWYQAASAVHLDLPWVITPSGRFTVQTHVVNTALSVSLAWRERLLEPAVRV